MGAERKDRFGVMSSDLLSETNRTKFHADAAVSC